MTSLILDHKTALLARLNGDPHLNGCGYEGVVLPTPDPAAPNDPKRAKYPEKYWTVFTSSGARTSDRLGGIPGQLITLRYTIHWVASTPTQAQDLADRGVSLIAGWQPAITGWSPFRFRHIDNVPTQMDDTVKPPLHFLIDQFELQTQPG